MKPATVIISGRAPGENLQDIDLPPGATALDVLQAVGLDRQWTLSREGSNQSWAHEEPIYDAVESGGKLRAAPLAEVGMRLPDWLACLLEGLGLHVPAGVSESRPTDAQHASTPTATKARVSAQSGSSVLGLAPRTSSNRSRVPVARDQRSFWEVRGWRRAGNKLIGAYRLGRRGAFAGEIDLTNPYRPEFYIINPPQAVLNGNHASCFRKRRDGKYAVHFGIAQAEPDAGVLAIERLLAASL